MIAGRPSAGHLGIAERIGEEVDEMDQVDVLFDQQLLEGRVAVWIDPRAKPVVGAGVQHAFLARAAMPVDHRLPGPMRTGVKQVKVVLAGQCHAKLVGVQLGAAPGRWPRTPLVTISSRSRCGLALAVRRRGTLAAWRRMARARWQ